MAVTFSKWKTPIKEQDPEVRRSNFKEVCLGYSVEEGIKESERCLQCKTKPCVKGCPWRSTSLLSSNASKRETWREHEVLDKYTNLSWLSAAVCPQETQCESSAP